MIAPMIAPMIVLIQTALAVQLSTSYIDCPFGEAKIPGTRNVAKVYTKIGDNSTGGFDSDFATYSSEGQWRQYQIATCDDNLFTVYASDIDIVIPPDRRDAVGAALKQAVAALPDPAKPQVWERYSVAAAIYAALGRDERFLGDLWLYAAWTVRDAAVGYYAGLTGPETARRLIRAGWDELRKPLTDENRKKVLYNLAKVAHRGGFSTERDNFVASLYAMELSTVERVNVDRFRDLTAKTEPIYLQRVLDAYARALQAGGLRPEEIDRLTYTTADLQRRLGRWTEARAGYKAILSGDASNELQGMAQFLMGELPKQGR